MKILPLICILTLLVGCAELASVKQAVATHGAKGADEALSIARWEICEAATVGSIKREYGTTEGLQLWWDFCGTDVNDKVETPK